MVRLREGKRGNIYYSDPPLEKVHDDLQERHEHSSKLPKQTVEHLNTTTSIVHDEIHDMTPVTLFNSNEK